jgi:signal transduction histidine kinase
MSSLRRRAILGATAWAALSTAVGFIALLTFFTTQSGNRFDNQLLRQHRVLLVAIGNAADETDLIASYMTDPEYERTYSGRYWQVEGPDGMLLASRSLFDATLPLPLQADPAIRFWTGRGPDGAVRGTVQAVRLEDGSVWRLSVAEGLASLEVERQETRTSLLTALALVGSLSVLGAVLLTSAALRPLARLREEVAHRWDAGEALEPAAYPEEVAPLVADINILLDRNRRVIDGARRQAADLAHALKTPTAILRNVLEGSAGTDGDMADAHAALARIDAQITRSLARIRAGNAAASAFRTNIAASAERLARLFSRAPAAGDMDLRIEVPEDLTVAMDRQDLEEILGNLIDNAMKWRKSVVRVSALRDGADAVILVEDDGPGIAPERRAEALRAGGRLDTSSVGTGLGLAIAHDLVTAYDGTLTLDSSPDLGGLGVRITMPAMRGMLDRRDGEPAA